MNKWVRKYVWALMGVLAMLSAPTFAGGECRDLLRPLLLQELPDAGKLAYAKEVCRTEVESGDPDAEYQLALFYLGLTDWDVDKAIPLIMSAAQSGIPEAQYWLAWQYDEGPLLAGDVALARRWYERAGENEHRLALQRLADAYERGDLGLPVDGRKASVLRAKAAKCKNDAG